MSTVVIPSTLGYNNNGLSHDYFRKFTVSSATFGGGTPNSQQPNDVITFSTQYVIIICETSGAVCEYSFNGNDVHGKVDGTAGSPYQKIEMPFRVVSKFWLRAATGTPVVTVQAW